MKGSSRSDKSSASSLNSGRAGSGRHQGNLPIPSSTNLQLESGLQGYVGGQRREEEDDEEAANHRINEGGITKDSIDLQRRHSSSVLPDPGMEQKLQRLEELEIKGKENFELRQRFEEELRQRFEGIEETNKAKELEELEALRRLGVEEYKERNKKESEDLIRLAVEEYEERNKKESEDLK